MDWNTQLTRAICSAAGNMGVLRREGFFTSVEVKKSFGKKAYEQFKDWFEATQHFDQVKGDALYMELARGQIDEVKFKKLLFSNAFHWVWSIKPEKQRKAWEISRGLSKFEETL